MFDSLRFLRDHHVPHETEGHKHCRSGWVQVACPFCTGNPGWHLGHNQAEDYWHCYRCGYHEREEVIQALIGASRLTARRLLVTYGGRPIRRRPNRMQAGIDFDTPAPRREVALPEGASDELARGAAYLADRGFNAARLQMLWGLKYCGHLSEPSYRFRIVIPITWRGVTVSFQARDVTGQAGAKYLDCPLDREVLPHKQLLYGWDQALARDDALDWCVAVEGVTGVWRLGAGALATFGIQFNLNQAGLLRHFRRRYILFDRDPQAHKQALALAGLLAPFRGKTKLMQIPDELKAQDPGEISQRDADSLVEQIRGGAL